MRATLAAVVAAAAIMVGACGRDDGEPAAAEDTTTTTGATTTTTSAAATSIDDVIVWCTTGWNDFYTAVRDDRLDSTEADREMARIAGTGVDLDHPPISDPAADLVEFLEWDGGTPAPDPAILTDSILAISAACRDVGWQVPAG